MFEKIKNNKAFTLLETGIVLTIIGLIIGFVLIGHNLRRNANIAQTMSDIRMQQTAYFTYKKKYNQVPGDSNSATTFFGSTVNSVAVQNGDGDGRIGSTISEVFYAFQHLSLAGLIKGQYSTSSTPATPMTSLMQSPIEGGYYFFYMFYESYFWKNAIFFGKYAGDLDSNGSISPANNELQYGILTPNEAREIDLKYDNGVPTTGWIRGIEGGDYSAGSCVSGSSYVISDTKSCYLYFVLDDSYSM